MNSELKAMIKMAVDLFSAGKSALQKENFVTVVLPKLYQVASDIPGVAMNFSDMSAEFAALKSAPAEADLIAYVIASVSGVTTDTKAKAVIGAAIVMLEHLVQDAIALETAIKS